MTTALTAVRARVERVPPPVWALVGLMALFVAVFGTLTWRQHANFATFGFDMGIYDQGIWLLSRFRDPFVTVRGLHLFANHVDPVTLLFVPAYWLGAGPIFLSVVQAAWMAAGAVPIYLLGRDRLASPWLAVAVAGAFLANPTVEWVAHFHFHPEALAATPLLFAWWLATRGRWGWFVVAVAVAIACKESVTMATFVLGLVVAWRWNRRVGLYTAAGSLAWFVVATRVIIPAFNDGTGPFYADLYGPWGDSATDIAVGVLTHPGQFVETITDGARVAYYRDLLASLAFLPLVALAPLALALPQVLVNVLSTHALTHSIRYQYSIVVVAAMFLATIEMLGWRRRVGVQRFLVGALVAAALATNVAWSPSPISTLYETGIWAQSARPKHEAVNEALALIPDDAGVSAHYYLVPHLSHRRDIYEFPNPFRPTYWGVDGENAHDPARAEYLIVDRALAGESSDLLDELLASTYRTIFDRDGVVVAIRR